MNLVLPPPTLESWIDGLQSQGRYVFFRSDAVAHSGLSAESVKKALQRLARRGRIAKVKNYFFAIVPLEYVAAGSPPASWFIDDLMAAMQRPYYVGLLTAAGLHGASHHAAQQFQVLTNRPIRPITVGRSEIRFYASKFVNRAAVSNVKTPTGAMRFSTPETTAVDLVRFSRSAGELDHVATVIAELVPALDPKRLLASVKLVDDVPNAQRLGYVLEHVRARHLAEPIRNWVDRHNVRPVPLRSNHRVPNAREDRRWHVLIDRSIEVEA